MDNFCNNTGFAKVGILCGIMYTYMVNYSNQLSKIKETLLGLKEGLGSMSAEEKAKFDNSSAVEGMASDLINVRGILSSEQARRSVDNSKKNNNTAQSSGDEWVDRLQQANARAYKAEADKKKAEVARTNAEADLSIKEQQQSGLEAIVAGAGGEEQVATNTTQDTTGNILPPVPTLTPEDVFNYGLTPEQATDPFTASQVERFKSNTEIIGNTITAMGEMVATESAETRALMANIDAMTKNQQIQIDAEYRKRSAGTALAGIINGHALYSPEEHQGLIVQVVLEGKARLDEISLEGTKEKIKLQQNLRDFKYKTYVEQSDKLIALNDLKVETVTAIQSELLRINEEERDNMLFDQSQEERDATILAEELIDATDEQIIAAAKANGIPEGLLIGAVRSIKPDPVIYSGGRGGGGGSVSFESGDGISVTDGLSSGDKATVDSYAEDLVSGKITLSNVPKEWKDIASARSKEIEKEIALKEIDDVDLVSEFMADIENAKTAEGMGWWQDLTGGKEVDERFQDASAQAGKAKPITGTKTDIKRMLNDPDAQKALRVIRESEIKSGETFSSTKRTEVVMKMLIEGFFEEDFKGNRLQDEEGNDIWVDPIFKSEIDEKQRKAAEKKRKKDSLLFPIIPKKDKKNNIWS